MQNTHKSEAHIRSFSKFLVPEGVLELALTYQHQNQIRQYLVLARLWVQVSRLCCPINAAWTHSDFPWALGITSYQTTSYFTKNVTVWRCTQNAQNTRRQIREQTDIYILLLCAEHIRASESAKWAMVRRLSDKDITVYDMTRYSSRVFIRHGFFKKLQVQTWWKDEYTDIQRDRQINWQENKPKTKTFWHGG